MLININNYHFVNQCIIIKFTILMKRFFLSILLITSYTLAIGHDNDINFVENKGQWPSQVHFKSFVPGGQIWLENNRISYQFTKYPNLHANFKSTEKPLVYQHVVWANFVGANENYQIEKKGESKDYNNYFIGNDQSKWVSNAHSYEDIKYLDLYNNIDLRIYEAEGHLKYDFLLKPGGSNDININYEGQESISINKNGELVIKTSLGEVIEEKPYAYQIKNGIKKEVKCAFVLEDGIVSFSLGRYDKSLTLIIDPVLIFASYNGSPSDNFGMTATYDNLGNLYTGGTIYGALYPTSAGAFDPSGTISVVVTSAALSPTYGVTDVFISKYEPNGTSLIYSTYLGGGNDNGGTEAVHSLICDSIGNLHMFGTTSSSDFPVTATAYQDTLNGGVFQQFSFNGSTYWNNTQTGGGTDIFVTKFNAAGSALLGSTYIGGSHNDGLNYNLSGGTYNTVAAYDSLTSNYGDQFRGEIMIDEFGSIYIASSTYSTDFPIVNGFQIANAGLQDGVVCKFSPNLDNLIWSTYLGGTEKDAGYSVKLNSNLEVIVAGGTCSNNFPGTPGTIYPSYQGGITDGYITKIAANGTSILASTYIGTNSYDQCYFVEVDRFNTIYTVGQTRGAFPILNSPYSDPNSGAFIMRLDSNLATIDYSTVFGNGNVNAQFSPSAFLVDRCQNVYVSGWGGSVVGGSPLTGMRTTNDSITSAANDIIYTTSGDGFNFYLTVFERDMQSQLFGIYYGSPNSGDHVDGGTSRFDKNGIVYQSVCAGCNGDQNFPTTTGAYSQSNGSTNCNNGVFKFDFEIIPVAEFTVDNFQGCAPLTVTFTNSSNATDSYLWDFGGNDTTSQIFNPIKTYTIPGVYNVTLLITDSICNTVDTAFQTITIDPPITIDGGDTTTTCDTTTLSVTTTGSPTAIIWSSNNQFTDTLNTNLLDSNFFVTVSDTTWFYAMATNGPCSDIDSFLVNYVGFNILTNDTGLCLGNPIPICVVNQSNQTLTYSWSPASSIISGSNSACPIVNPQTATTYIVTAQNIYGCVVIDSSQVTPSGFDPININISADQDTLYAGAGTYLHVTPDTGFTYLWLPSETITNPTSANPYVTPVNTTTYTVILYELATGCEFSKTYTIYAFEILCGEPDVFLPNAFTPNQDNENDVLFVRGRNVEKLLLKIYDRWGELVFETNQQNIGWDGTFKGELVDPGVFVYYMDITCVDGQEYFKKGNITVIR